MVSVTIAVLTYNGDAHLRRVLAAIEAQRFDGAVDTLVIDSGSRDETLSIVAEHPGVRLHTIPNSEFGHGRTRNLAVQLATGEFIAFLTQDAVPIGDRWLHELILPMMDDDRIVAVMGKQVPRAGCFPLLKYEIERVFAGFGPDIGTTVFRHGEFVQDEGVLSAIAFYSDVNSAARTAFLRDQIPYRDVPYAEDQLFGRDLVLAGWAKAYAPRGAVEHSNDMTLDEYGPRIFDETVGLRRIGQSLPPLSRRDQAKLTVRGIAADSVRIAMDSRYSWKRKAYWLALNPLYHLRKWSHYRRATTVALDDESTIAAGSLEARRKKD